MKHGLSWRRAFAVAFVAIVFLALNTGANLVYLLVAMLAGSAAIPFLRLARAGEDLVFTRRLPDRIEAGMTFRVELSALNPSKRSHSLVRVTERTGKTTREIWFAGLSGGTSLATSYEISIPRRGMAFFPPPQLSVPAAFECARPLETGPGTFALVHPRPAEPPAALSGSANAFGLDPVDLSGDADFAGLARAPHGERASRLHWGAYARTGEPHCKLFRDRSTDSLLLFLVAADPFAIERGVALAAGFVNRLRSEGVRFLFASLGEKLSRSIDGSDECGLLDHLALLPPRTIPLAAERAGAAIESFHIAHVLALVPASHPATDEQFTAAAGTDQLIQIVRYEADDPVSAAVTEHAS